MWVPMWPRIGNAIQTLFGSTVQEPLKMLACLVGAAAVNWRLLIVFVADLPAGFPAAAVTGPIDSTRQLCAPLTSVP